MATKSKETLSTGRRTATKKSTAKQAQSESTASKAKSKTTTKKTKARTATARQQSSKATAPKDARKDASKEMSQEISKESGTTGRPLDAATTQMPLIPSVAEPTLPSEAPGNSSHETASHHNNSDTNTDLTGPSTSELKNETSKDGMTFLAANCIGSDMWVPSAAIPAIDEATYRAQKAQAEAQRRAIEVASLNLKNINDLHQLERQSIDVAISTKENETRHAQLTSADIDYQTQLEHNGEKSQHLRQATARREAATRESDYTDQLIALKDQNFELDIQQAQSAFSEKAARYRAQLTGQ